MVKTMTSLHNMYKQSKVLPYSLPSVGPRADPGVQAVSPQVTISHPPGGRLPLLSARPAFYIHKRSPDGATPNWGNRHLITAYYSSINPEGMKGWVGLVGWPIADGLPSATGRAQDRESLPARDQCSTAVPRSQPTLCIQFLKKQQKFIAAY